MKSLFKIIVLLVILAFCVCIFNPAILADSRPFIDDFLGITSGNLLEIIKKILPSPPPCSRPITYKLNTFDAQFGISKQYFLNAMSDAEARWENAVKKELFAYTPENGVLKINLIYDYRQQATETLEDLNTQVKDNQSYYDSLKAKYEILKTKYSTAKDNYQTQLDAFNNKVRTYEESINYWNSQGGAPKKEYSQLNVQKIELQNESEKLKTMQTQLNEMGNEINTLVTELNRLVKSLNLTVSKYNTIGTSRGESFEEGLYRSDGRNQEINVYEFSSREKLVRLLAHELGHALGIDHVLDTKAIMYELNQSTTETLTNADLTALKTICGIK